VGVLMALGAAFCYALAAIVAKKLDGMAPHLIALIQVCVGIAMLAPFANLKTLPTDAGTWGIHLTMGVIYTGLVFILLYGAIQKLPTTVAGALSFIYPGGGDRRGLRRLRPAPGAGTDCRRRGHPDRGGGHDLRLEPAGPFAQTTRGGQGLSRASIDTRWR
jgi:hypothetical protein